GSSASVSLVVGRNGSLHDRRGLRQSTSMVSTAANSNFCCLRRRSWRSSWNENLQPRSEDFHFCSVKHRFWLSGTSFCARLLSTKRGVAPGRRIDVEADDTQEFVDCRR